MDNKRKGLIGETAVVLKLLENGWNAVNLNVSIPNYKGADIVCMMDDGSTCMVQVKTACGENPNFVTGFVSDNKGNIEGLEKKIVGPWVFVQMLGEGIGATYRFYVLSRLEVLSLINDSNRWYMNEAYHRKELSNKTMVGLPLAWIRGDGYCPESKTYKAYKSVITSNPENRWEKIWE